MAVFGLQPLIDYASKALICYVTHYYNRRYVYHINENSNSKNDYLVFLDTYAGPEYVFYYKAAITNIVVFTCILFGGSMPILYFIGLFALIIQYLVDRWTLAYFYRLPAKYRADLTIGSIKMLSLAPLLSLAILIW